VAHSQVEWAYLAHADHSQDRESLDWMINMLSAVGHRPIALDVGCGAGLRVEQALVDADMNVVGVDPSPVAVDTARQTLPAAIHAERDLYDLDGLHPVGARFDAVVSMFALAAVPRADVRRTLTAVHHALAPGGVLLLAMPEGDSDVRDPAGAAGQTAFPSKHLRRVLEEAAFEVVEVRQVGQPDGHVDLFARCLKRLAAA
jgi:cyclopropane fatty-acyl-phospholipid synthase-like methyltransferase